MSFSIFSFHLFVGLPLILLITNFFTFTGVFSSSILSHAQTITISTFSRISLYFPCLSYHEVFHYLCHLVVLRFVIHKMFECFMYFRLIFSKSLNIRKVYRVYIISVKKNSGNLLFTEKRSAYL